MCSITDINYNEVDHDKTFREALAAYPDHDWLVVGFHEAIYGSYLNGYKDASVDPLDYCNDYYKKFITLFDRYKPDLCLTGHSHIYGRSYFIRDGEIQDVDRDTDGAYLDPQGTLYVNMGTSSRMWQFGNTSTSPNWPFDFLEFTCTENGKALYTYGLLKIADNELTLEIYDNLHPDVLIDTVTVRKQIAERPEESETASVGTETDHVEPGESESAKHTDSTLTETQEAPQAKGGCGAVTGGAGVSALLSIGIAAPVVFKRKRTRK